MYAYAFGSFFEGLMGVESVIGFSLRPVISVLAVTAFVGLNVLGARTSGMTENIMVGAKVLILLIFGLWGLYFGADNEQLEFGLSRIAGFGPIMAAAVSFVAFEGWQLLFYDQESVKDRVNTIRKAVYITIPSAIIIYIIVAITTVSLAPLSVIAHNPERALAVAAEPFMGRAGFILISLAALFSTGSAINATLFSTGYFAKGMVSMGLLPDKVGDSSKSGIPLRTLVVIGVITAVFTWFGSLNSVTSFASIAFIVVFGITCYIAFTQRKREGMNPILPLVGMVGSMSFIPLMFWHLYRSEPEVFYTVLLLSAGIIIVELFYFEREILVETARKTEEAIEKKIGVIMRDGSKEEFDIRRLEESLVRVGAPVEIAEDVIHRIRMEREGGIHIDEIRKIIMEEIDRIEEGKIGEWTDDLEGLGEE